MSRDRLLVAGVALGAGLALFLPWAWEAMAGLEGLVYLPVALAVVAAMAGLGLLALRLVGASAALEPEDAWIAIPVGAGVLGHAQLALAHLHAFGRAPSIVLVLLGLAALARELTRPGRPQHAWTPIPSGWALLCAPFLAGGLVLCALPPTFYDALAYHSGLIHQFLARGGAVITAHDHYTAMPLAAELSAGTAFAIGGAPEAMGLVFGLWFFVLVMGAASTARALFGAATAGPAAFAIASSPIALFLAAATKCDVLVALLLLAALRATRPLAADGVPAHVRAAAWRLGGLLLGLAAATKLTTLPLVVVLVAALALLPAVRRALLADRGALVGAVALFLVAAAPPYLRNLVALGNPFFPFASSIFGGPPWIETTAELFASMAHRAASPGEAAALLWRAFAGTDGTTNEVLGGVLLLALLFPVVVGAPRASQPVLLALLLSLPVWLSTHALPRYDPLLWVGAALLAAAVIERLMGTRLAWALGPLLVALALLSASWSLRANEVLLHQPSRLIVGKVSRDEHLRAALPLYAGLRAATAAARATPAGCVFLATTDPRIAFLDAPAVLSEVLAQPALATLRDGGAGDDVVIERIRATGATHVLVGRPADALVAKWRWVAPPTVDALVGRLPKIFEDEHSVLLTVPDPRPGACNWP